MTKENLTFRYATEEDASLVLSFIKELADYEKMSDDVIANENLLKKWIFQEKKAEVFFASLNGKEIGFALFFHNFSTFVGRSGLYLEDIYIKPEYRKNGYGKKMFNQLVKIAKERDCGRLELVCLDWNTPSIAFYKSLGAISMDEWTIFRITDDKFEKIINSN